MPPNERRYGVWLYSERVGTLNQRGDYTWFAFSEEYLADPARPVLGLAFEENLRGRHASALRLPPWFSNLLPEGRLRDWIANSKGVSVDREMELLAQVGRDLPGAVQVLPEDEPPDVLHPPPQLVQSIANQIAFDPNSQEWRFSLAGVALKFSMVQQGNRLTLPAYGEGGDWIVKLPDPTYVDVPRNEHAMMSLAGAAGITVPAQHLVHRNSLTGLPEGVWQSREEYAYAVRRFDRLDDRAFVHIEDLAQVRNIYPYGGDKYMGNFETVASLIYRGRDLPALQEFARRLAFNVVISNGDAHLKNWSLIYLDRRIPTLSPAYDLVSTAVYRAGSGPEDLGLKFGGSRRLDQVSLGKFRRLQERLGASVADLPGCVVDTVDRVVSAWPSFSGLLDENPDLQAAVDKSIRARSQALLHSSVW